MNANTVVNEIPEGYRPATATEIARMMHPAYFTRMVQVKGAKVQPLTGFAIQR